MFEFTYYRGRVALAALLKINGIGKGDKVAIQAFTCSAVPEALLSLGAVPVYVDTSSNSVTMDAEDLRHKAVGVRAVVVQHTFGIPADMESLVKVCSDLELPIIEDCAHSIYTEIGGKVIGSFGVGAFYSFEWGKPIIAGLGGAAVVSSTQHKKLISEHYDKLMNEKYYQWIRHALQYSAYQLLYAPRFYWALKAAFHGLGKVGLVKGNHNVLTIDNTSPEFQLRMSSFHKARLAGAIKAFEESRLYREQLVSSYTNLTKGASIKNIIIPSNSRVEYARYPLLVRNKKELLEKARSLKVELAEWYTTPVHPFNEEELRVVGYESGSCPNAEFLCRHVVSLPVSSRVASRDIVRIRKLLGADSR